MLSKNQIKLITSLHQKKYRNKHQLFFVEGSKSVLEFLNSAYELDTLYHTTGFTPNISQNKSQLISDKALKKISALKNPNTVLAVFKMPLQNDNHIENGFILVLDDIKDPGNLGTIIRLCDWFNVKQIVCSLETVDCYNPKVVQATMGSLTRISIRYKGLNDYLNSTKLPVFATVMDGQNVYHEKLPKKAIIVMGNEANGISLSILETVSNKISIPKFGNLQQTESLNVASATAILLSEFSR
jgi:TrmH family RNA methyltransferase